MVYDLQLLLPPTGLAVSRTGTVLAGVHAALLLQAAFTQAIVVRTVCDFGTLYSRFGNRQIEMQIAFQTITP